ncbi:MAG: hypothetical protein U9R17_02395 [Thermodesulfobacteriota bacterium]|nr:hypothetical protein [Thermodesulfobacteriota bacterium]
MKVFADKLIKITEGNSEKISRQWCKTVRKSNRTQSYHEIPEENCIAQAVTFYKNLSRIYFSEKPSRDLYEYFSQYAEERYDEGIPCPEAIYALFMMRRQMWLFADSQAAFLTPMDHIQAIEALNKTIRIFDVGIFFVAQKYDALKSRDGFNY